MRRVWRLAVAGGHLVLKGKSRSLLVYEPLTTAYRSAYEVMDREDPEAPTLFRKLAEEYPGDPLAAFHANRLAAGHTGNLAVMMSK